MVKLRRTIQLLFLLLFLVLFLRARYPYQVSIPSDFFLRFSPLTPLFYFIDSLYLPAFLWPALLILLLTPVFGRFFCGWMCPLGTALDIFSHLVKSPDNRRSQKWEKFRSVKFGLLLALIIMAVFSLPLWGYLDPLAIFTRMTTILLYPLFTLFAETTLDWLSRHPVLETIGEPAYDFFKNVVMPENQAHHTAIFSVLVLVVIIFALEKLSRRFWCRYLCPAGALLGLLSVFRIFGRKVSSDCPVCYQCVTQCKMGAIPREDVHRTRNTECIQSFSCATTCPPKTLSIYYRFHWSWPPVAPDFSRRTFLRSLGGGILTLGLFQLQPSRKKEKDRLIRPPGALVEEEFLDRCIRCLECVRICESNGGCLQPSGFETGWENLWTPVARMRDGYCEYECNLCGQVCPTNAILPLTLEEKKHTPMGIAYFDKNICIPYARNEDCIVCEEHCPVPEKAIRFEQKEVTLPDGTQRMVKFPYVVRELCIGCGICETKCPLPGAPGIFVTRENEKRFLPGENEIISG